MPVIRMLTLKGIELKILAIVTPIPKVLSQLSSVTLTYCSKSRSARQWRLLLVNTSSSYARGTVDEAPNVDGTQL